MKLEDGIRGTIGAEQKISKYNIGINRAQDLGLSDLLGIDKGSRGLGDLVMLAFFSGCLVVLVAVS